MKGRTLLLIAVSLMFLITILGGIPVIIYYGSGAFGDLTLTISLDKVIVKVNESLFLTWTLKNTGSTNVRVPEFKTPYGIIDIRNSTCSWAVPRIRYDIVASNDDLKLIRPGHSIVGSFDLLEHYGMENIDASSIIPLPPDTYIIVGHARIGRNIRYTLPYWTGELPIDDLEFTVL